MQEVKKQYYICGAIMALPGVILIPVMTLLYGFTEGELIRNCVFAVFFSLGLAYYYTFCISVKKFEYDNYEHPYRFLAVYGVSFAVSILLPLVDVSGWIYLSIAVSLALFSNTFLGIYTTAGLILYSCMLKSDADIYVFFVYFMAAFLGVVLFQEIDNDFDVVHSLLISVVIQFVLEIAGFVLLKNAELSAEQFIIPLVNAILNAMIIFWVLKYFNEKVANKYRNRYLEINDQEYKALIELKQRSPREYWCSIHTAYLVDRMSRAMDCNVDRAKALAYYHRIKKAYSYSSAATDKFLKDNEFPPEAAEALIRYWSRNNRLITKEEGIVFISANFISTLQSLFGKDKKAKVNYEELYESLMKKDFMTKALSDSDLSVKDFKTIKEIILKEKLYYDFLR